MFFGTALGNFGVDHMLDGLVEWAPAPMPRNTDTREVTAAEEKFTGFVFKIQANMDPKHRDRVAFMRVVSGKYERHEAASGAYRQRRGDFRRADLYGGRSLAR